MTPPPPPPRPVAPPLAAVRAALLLVALAAGGTALAQGTYRQSPHGSRDSGVLRIPGLKRGECTHCHGSPRGAGRGPTERRGHAGLFASGNALCAACHRTSTASFLGEAQYDASTHGSSALVVWPGPTPPGRSSADAGKCVNCHDPHGERDAAGLVPAHLHARGARLCLGCHTGNPGTDVASALARAYRHPLLDPAAPPGAAAASPPGSESCGACHNPHAAGSGRGQAAGVAPALAGVPRVRVSNGPAGAPPVLTPVTGRDTALAREHEVCFRCHSSGAPTPARGADIAAAFNPANASVHPVEERARPSNLDRRSMTTAWRTARVVTCSDCHGSDDGLSRGPHGSSFPRILARRHLEPAASEPQLETDLCFACHAYGTYGDPGGGAGGSYSFFPGHLSHAGHGVACSACHTPHGSPTLPALLHLRSPGIAAYSRTTDGGSCTVTCHHTAPSTATYRASQHR